MELNQPEFENENQQITPFTLCRSEETNVVHIKQLPIQQKVETKQQFIDIVRYVHAMGNYRDQQRSKEAKTRAREMPIAD